ncbi:MAG: CBS domain-containing protein [Planctomycetota bacterium]|jgi:CBS domain-containing protein
MQAFSICARDIMVTRLTTLAPEDDVLDGIDRLLQHSISGAPVVDAERRFLGVFSERSCIVALSVFAQEQSRRCDDHFEHTCAGDVMTRTLFTVSPDADAFAAIQLLLEKRVSGLPVINSRGEFLGIFSEHAAMRVVIDMAWNQLSDAPVSAWMDHDQKRIISESTTLEEIRRQFSETHYRRLPVARGQQLVGQISRRDVLQSELDHLVGCYESSPASLRTPEDEPLARREKWQVQNFMNESPATISEDTDLLTMTQKFHSSSGRRFPVVRDGRLVGQVSRRDVLSAVRHLFPDVEPIREPLYLSSTENSVASVLG